MRWWHSGIIVLAVIATASVAGHTSQPQAPDAKEGQNDGFGAKIILATTAHGAHTLKNVQTRKLGDRAFLVGTSVRDSNLTQESFGNRTTWLPVSDITEIVEFDDLAQLRRIGNGQE